MGMRKFLVVFYVLFTDFNVLFNEGNDNTDSV